MYVASMDLKTAFDVARPKHIALPRPKGGLLHLFHEKCIL